MIENSARTATPRAYHAFLRPTSAVLNCRTETSTNRLHRDLFDIESSSTSLSVRTTFDFSTSIASILLCDLDDPDFSTSSGNDMLGRVDCAQASVLLRDRGTFAITEPNEVTEYGVETRSDPMRKDDR